MPGRGYHGPGHGVAQSNAHAPSCEVDLVVGWRDMKPVIPGVLHGRIPHPDVRHKNPARLQVAVVAWSVDGYL